MLSINIPVYNYEVGDLVNQLVAQAEDLKIQFEIRVYDDGSEEEVKLQNRRVAGNDRLVYLELERNYGRAAIRNKMGFESKFEYLLFIDADSLPVDKNYIRNYIENLKPNRVLCGGTEYKLQKPVEPGKYLRWVYGISREAISAEIRNRKKGFIITSNNFLIEKQVFENVHFREELKKYGHEDTLLGYDLFKSEIEIFHINNPVEHTGLEDSSEFIEKTRTALISLYEITHVLLPGDKTFIRQVNFLNRYYKITRYLPSAFLRMFYRLCRGFIEKDLSGSNPSLLLFDLYKLGYYATLK